MFFSTLLSCLLNKNSLDNLNIDNLKNVFCFSTEYEECGVKSIIYSLKETEFQEILNKYMHKNLR